MVLANPKLVFPWADEEIIADLKDDISWSWYIIADSFGGIYVTIDLSKERLGRCYDSSWDVYPGNSSIIAESFTELLARLFADQGQQWYWCRSGHQTFKFARS